MKKSKRSKPLDRDRLSELPDSVIFHIFWFIRMSDVVRTTVLSKRWRYLWTTTPFLNFLVKFDNKWLDDTQGFRNSVNKVLFRWNGPRILKLKFKVDSDYDLDESISSDVDLWVNFAREKKVEELNLFEIFDKDLESREEICLLPHCLYSCSSLKVLSLGHCDLGIDGNVQWNQLESLTITRCFGVTENSVNQILSGSPRLEVLNLSFVDRGECLNIRSTSLKELSICKYLYDLDDLSLVSEMTIWTPNLETLKIEGFPYTNCRLINVSSLTCAIIGFRGLVYEYDEEIGCDFDFENGSLSSSDYIGDYFSQILQTIQHVESVTLSYCCLKVLGATKMRCMNSSFPNVKSLKIGRCGNNSKQLAGLLDIFPQLERLVFQDNKLLFKYDPEALKYEAILRTIEVTWINGDDIFPVIAILLKDASKLEKLVFRVDRIISLDCLLEASMKLLDMPRSSADCSIVFLRASDPQ